MANSRGYLKIAVCAAIGIAGLACQLPVYAESTVEVFPVVEAKANPFLTKKEEKLFAEQGTAIPIEYLQLSAIFYSSDKAKSCVVINGRVLKKGDSVDSKEITEINPEEVKLQDPVGTYVVKLNNVIDMKAYQR